PDRGVHLDRGADLARIRGAGRSAPGGLGGARAAALVPAAVSLPAAGGAPRFRRCLRGDRRRPPALAQEGAAPDRASDAHADILSPWGMKAASLPAIRTAASPSTASLNRCPCT